MATLSCFTSMSLPAPLAAPPSPPLALPFTSENDVMSLSLFSVPLISFFQAACGAKCELKNYKKTASLFLSLFSLLKCQVTSCFT